MTWQVEWTDSAKKEFRALDRDIQRRIRETIARIAANESSDVKRLQEFHPPEYRARTGAWRVRFTYEHATRTIRILHILRRDEAY